ncbi:uncharacterized protein BCR38DRAFT_483682 [Pseudomassariella vexata]|uniref:RING-type domain-containing protein n=1 Tax=Pseudomassariella vexata TaxID=1141098 RepID=A0A1Y2E386_9PEZI|nr:uncharacterized protein BCR38DRAFT_483682 [Pseudomassariella vexata]ORY66021.1 hypothetical protein BCR38DRAFT_483682 [Pseudomassariella vexata]
MPPRSSLASSFSITDSNNEVVCPLRNQDGSSCRKRCIGEKRYRSMQEHIRRAHPEHYISKLPATEESFMLMISTPPSERAPPVQQNSVGPPRPPPQQQAHANVNRGGPPIDPALGGYPLDRHAYLRDDLSAPGTPGNFDEFTGGPLLPAASAAAALAQLGQGQKTEPEWDSGEEWPSDPEGQRIPRTTIELPPIHIEPTSEPYPPLNSARQRDLLPSILSNSPPGRSSTLPPLQRPLGPNRPRKQSVTKRGHKKQKSRGTAAEWLRRIQNDDRLKPGGIDRKAHSVEPMADYGKRWEDLIDAAASATEDIEDDRTPVPQSPISMHRASLPPFNNHYQSFQGYQASPLQQALTPPSFAQEMPDPFPSVESGESGDNFHIGTHGLTDSSPSYSSLDVHIYCAACQRTSKLRESYACTECICGLCRECVSVLVEEQGARRKCPRCATIGGRFKPFQLDIR